MLNRFHDEDYQPASLNEEDHIFPLNEDDDCSFNDDRLDYELLDDINGMDSWEDY